MTDHHEALTSFLRRAIPHGRPRSWRSIRLEAEEHAPREVVHTELFNALCTAGLDVIWLGAPGERSIVRRPDPARTRQTYCPKCGAEAGSPCVRLSLGGGYKHTPHRERDAALLAAEFAPVAA